MGCECSCGDSEASDQIQSMKSSEKRHRAKQNSSEKLPRKTIDRYSESSRDDLSPKNSKNELKVALRDKATFHKILSANSLYRIETILESTPKETFFLAEFTATHQRCVLRKRPNQRNSRKERTIAVSEVEVVSNLDHPNIVKIYEGYEDYENICVVYEALEGPTLAKYLAENGRVTELFAAKVMMQILSAVAYCHSRAVLHGDIRPENIQFIFTDVENRPELKIKGFDGEIINPKLRALITNKRDDSPFIPPERTPEASTGSGDVWACGIILFMMLTKFIIKTKADKMYLRKLTSKTSSLLGTPSIAEFGIEAKQFIVALLQPLPSNRISASAALGHPWLVKANESLKASSVSKVLHNLSSHKPHTLIRIAILKFILKRVAKSDYLITLAEHFRAIDVNHDGLIDLEELTNALMMIKPEQEARAEAESIMKSADENENGMLDYSEFLLLSYADKDLLSRENLLAAFNAIDKDHSGKISLKELQNLLEVADGGANEVAWNRFMFEIDPSGDGEIDFQEFREIMLRSLKKSR